MIPVRMFHLEDDPNDAELFATGLSRSGKPCKLTQFGSAEAAIQAMQKIMVPEMEAPHLIISDLKLPGMNGFEFATWLRRSRFSCIPLIILSGSSLAGDVAAAYRCGANSFATKPVSVHQLNEMVGTILKYWNDVCSVTAHGENVWAHNSLVNNI
jgi:CheY-like chemotaxis protein